MGFFTDIPLLQLIRMFAVFKFCQNTALSFAQIFAICEHILRKISDYPIKIHQQDSNLGPKACQLRNITQAFNHNATPAGYISFVICVFSYNTLYKFLYTKLI